jgi:hypothetical protein
MPKSSDAMLRLLSTLLMSAALMTAAASALAQPVRVEGVAAFVGGGTPGPGVVVILRSDVALRAELAVAARRRGDAPLPEPLLSAVLEELVSEGLIAREADRLRASPPTEAAVEEERQRLVADAGGEARVAEVLSRLEVSEDELEAVARRRAYVGAFLRANLEGAIDVSEAEIQRVYDEGAHPFLGQSLDDAREPLRVWLGRRRLRQEVTRWVEVLGSRTVIRRVATWSSEG